MRTRGELTPIGLDVGSRFVKAVQARRGARGAPTVVAAAKLPRPRPGQAVDAGEAERLLDVLDRQGFRGDRVVLGVPADRLLTGSLELPPKSSGAPLGQIARMELARTTKCDPARIEIAFWEIPGGGRAVEGTHVIAVGCRHEDSGALLDVFDLIGASVTALEAPVTALARACAPLYEEQGALTGLLEIGCAGAMLSVVLAGRIVYERPIPSGGLRGLAKAIEQGLGVEPEVADYVVERVGVEGGESAEELQLLEEARALVTGHTENLAKEVRTSLSYAGRRYNAAPGALLVTGGGASVPGLTLALGRMLGLPCRSAAPRDVCAGGDGPLLSDPALTLALGLATYEQGVAA